MPETKTVSPWQILESDCIEAMAAMEPCSIDAIVCDPPYGLGFMGKAWDALPPGLPWARQCLRVLKPGGHLVAFGGTRTIHRLACAIEDAGFEVRDTIAWQYWSGFPKSLDVSKAIDRRGGALPVFAEFRDAVKAAMRREGVARSDLAAALGNFMLSHYLTAGSQPAIPNLRDYKIIRDRLDLGDVWDHLFLPAADRAVVGRHDGDMGGLGGQRLGDRGADITAPATDDAKRWQGWGTALKPSFEPAILARKPLNGTVAANVLRWGTGALNVDGCRYAYGDPAWPGPNDRASALAKHESTRGLGAGLSGETFGTWGAVRVPGFSDLGRWPANVYACPKASRSEREAGCRHLPARSGADAVERVEGSAGMDNPRAGAGRTAAEVRNHHPTIKPAALMAWLCRLVTPPGGVILDPFCGSGTTGLGALRGGFDFVGIEREAEYVRIARARIEGDSPLFNRRTG